MDPVTLAIAKKYTDDNIIAGDGIPLSTKDAANGVPSLDALGYLTAGQESRLARLIADQGKILAWDDLMGSGALTGSVAPSGQTWVSSASQLQRTATGAEQTVGGIQYHTLDAGATNVMAQMDVTSRSAGRQQMLLRYVDASNYLTLNIASGVFSLVQVVAGVSTTLVEGGGYGTTNIGFGTNVRLRVRLANNYASVWADDQYIGSASLTAGGITALGASTLYGIRHNNTAGVCYRNLLIRSVT